MVFADSISSEHHRRAEILSYLIENGVDLKVYSKLPNIGFKSAERLLETQLKKRFQKSIDWIKEYAVSFRFPPSHKDLVKVCLPPVYGIDFYKCLASAKICLNIHIDLTTDFSGNMRMYRVQVLVHAWLQTKKLRTVIYLTLIRRS